MVDTEFLGNGMIICFNYWHRAEALFYEMIQDEDNLEIHVIMSLSVI